MELIGRAQEPPSPTSTGAGKGGHDPGKKSSRSTGTEAGVGDLGPTGDARRGCLV